MGDEERITYGCDAMPLSDEEKNTRDTFFLVATFNRKQTNYKEVNHVKSFNLLTFAKSSL
jgi:hypothetical protein